LTSDKRTHQIKGFSLVELIITIAIFGLISGVLMRFFVIAGTAENIANDRQQTASISQTILENFKHSDDMTSFINTINNGSVDSYETTTSLETIKVSLTKAWEYTTLENDNAFYEMVITVTHPSENIRLPQTSFDLALDLDSAATVTLTAVEDPSRGLCYRVDNGDGETEMRNIDIHSTEPVTLLLNLKGAGTGEVIVKNDLIAATDVIFYDAYKNNVLNVTLNRSVDNAYLVSQIGSGIVTIAELEDAETKGVYTIKVAFNKKSTSENLGVFIGKKYGGM